MINRLIAALIIVVGLALNSPAKAEWLRGESEHFIVYGDTSERAMTRYVQKLERFDQLLRLYLPARSEFIAPKLPIYMVRSNAQMRAVWPDIPRQVGGFYARSEERIFAMAGEGGENDSVLLHEYAHHYMYQNFNAPYPAWFVEGFAEYYSTAELTPTRVRIGLNSPGRMNSLTGGSNSWATMEALLSSRRTGRNRIVGHAFYAQAWALTHYLMSTPERQAMLSAYLRAVGGGADPVAALDGTINRTPDQLQSDVQRYMGGPIPSFTPQHTFVDADVAVRPLSAAERDSLWLDLRLARFVPEQLRAANLQEALALQQRHPGEPMPARVLAQAYLDMKQPAEASAVLTPIVAAHPEDALSLRMLAVSLMDEGDAEESAARKAELYAQARPHLARAYQQEAGDYRIYLAMARNREDAPGYPTENDLQTLVLAAELAPQLPSVRMKAARGLMHHGQHVQAILLLRPIANDPHGGSNLSAVRTLLSQAYAGAGLKPTGDALAQEGEEDDPDDERPDDEGGAEVG